MVEIGAFTGELVPFLGASYSLVKTARLSSGNNAVSSVRNSLVGWEGVSPSGVTRASCFTDSPGHLPDYQPLSFDVFSLLSPKPAEAWRSWHAPIKTSDWGEKRLCYSLNAAGDVCNHQKAS